MRFSVSTAIAALTATSVSATAVGPVDGTTLTTRQTNSCQSGFTFCNWGGSCIANNLYKTVEGVVQTVNKSGKKCYQPPNCLSFAKSLNVDPSLVTGLIATGPAKEQISYFSKEICSALDKSSLILCGLKQDVNLNVAGSASGSAGSGSASGSASGSVSGNAGPIKFDINAAIKAAVSSNGRLVENAANGKTVRDITQSLQPLFIKSIQDASAIWNTNFPLLSCSGLLGNVCDCLHNAQTKNYCRNVITTSTQGLRSALSPQTLNGCGLKDGVFQTLGGGQLIAQSLACITSKVLGGLNLAILKGVTCPR